MLLVAQGNYYLNNSNSADAADAWQRAVNLDPQNVLALFNLGIVEMRMNKLDDARSNFQKVLKIEPDADSYETLGAIALLEGKYREAIEMNKKAVSLNSQSHSAWGNLASAYTWSGDREQAAASYHKAIDLAQAESVTAPGDTTLLAELANYYASIGDATDSLPLIRKVLALAPDDPHIVYLAGESYELLSQREKAIPLISRALAEGYQTSQFQRSPELASLRGDPAFQTALAQAKAEKAVDRAK
jgi:tetratricopeptide (TPR) repeat protein